MSTEKLSQVKLNSTTGKWEGDGLAPSAQLAVIPLHVNKGRQYYGGTYSDGKGAQPVCWSTNGVLPVLPAPGTPGVSRFAKFALEPQCAGCQGNLPGDRPGTMRCEPLWSLLALLPTEEVRLVLINSLSQRALEQWLVQLDLEIKRVEAERGTKLRMVDFAMTLKLEKRTGMKLHGLGYPISGSADRFERIPLVGGVSKYDAVFQKYDHESQKQAASAKALDQLLNEQRGRIEEKVSVDEMLEDIVA